MSLTVSPCTQTRFYPGPINQNLPPTSDSSYPQLHSHLRNKARITKNTKCTAFDNTNFISTCLFCAVYTEETGLESYKVSLTEPMHDLKNLLIHILQELVFVKWTSEPEAVTLFARAYEVIWFDAQVNL